MIRVGYWALGYLSPNKIAADGCYHIRDSLFDTLIKNDCEIFYLGKLRDKPDRILEGSTYQKVTVVDTGIKELERHYGDFQGQEKKTYKWFRQHMFDRDLPDVDIFISELSCIALNSYDIMSIVNHYTKKNVPCFLWDMDCWAKGIHGSMKNFNIGGPNVYTLTPYRYKSFDNQIVFYYGYDATKELPNNAVYDFAYVGNDYKRGKKLKKFYSPLNAHIYGKFIKDKEKVVDDIGRDKFKGPIYPMDVVSTYANYHASIQVVPSQYEKLGLMTQRINEVNYAGGLLFMDEDIVGAKRFTLPDQVISSGKQAARLLKEFLKDNSIHDRVLAQRALLPTYDSQISKILSKV